LGGEIGTEFSPAGGGRLGGVEKKGQLKVRRGGKLVGARVTPSGKEAAGIPEKKKIKARGEPIGFSLEGINCN